MLKLLVIEDHALVREGLLQALKSLEADVVTLGAADAEAGLRKRFPAIPVIVLSALDDPDTVSRAMRQGASGFVPKSSSTATMVQALRDVLAGEIWLPPRLRDPAARGTGRGRDVAERFGLTPAQMRVLELLIQGKTNRQIAELLDVTEGTVKIHVSAIFKAMNVTNRSQALLLASKNRMKA